MNSKVLVMGYFIISKEGDRFGPISLDTLNRFLKNRRVLTTTLIEVEGWSKPIPASEIPGIELPKPKFKLFKKKG